LHQASPTRPHVGALMRVARQRKGMSQRELSLMVGRSPAYVNKLEAGVIEPSFQAVSEVAVALALTPLETWVLCRIALLRDRHTPVVPLTVAEGGEFDEVSAKHAQSLDGVSAASQV
jgi:transcriptional regulator with XRE-family HTH domain